MCQIQVFIPFLGVFFEKFCHKFKAGLQPLSPIHGLRDFQEWYQLKPRRHGTGSFVKSAVTVRFTKPLA